MAVFRSIVSSPYANLTEHTFLSSLLFLWEEIPYFIDEYHPFKSYDKGHL